MDLKASTNQYYSESAESFTANTLHVDMSEFYQRFLPYIPPNAHILDAGCGSGRDAKRFKSLGFQVDAFDASPELAAIASKLLQLPVVVQTFQQFDGIDLYDGIWCCASLLHVPNLELNDVIKRLHRALKYEGVLYMSFKYGIEERVKEGRFFNDQTEQTIQQYLSGFRVLDTWVTGDQRPDRGSEQWLNLIVQKQEP
ncbi:class I SAM-dependent methyltransferase [Rhodanobacter aciditrophus]|uniref:Class I SAM-dependent methyltransferase n=1 Tax=Rhodanobacter aciditrophus TaxID=1623218 RepID=A0ABW4B6J0_9GAMM